MSQKIVKMLLGSATRRVVYAIILCLPLFALIFPWRGFILDSITNIIQWVIIVWLFVMMILAVCRRWRWLMSTMMVHVLLVTIYLYHNWPDSEVVLPANQPTIQLTAIFYNAQGRFDDRFVQWVEQVNPDIISVVERPASELNLSPKLDQALAYRWPKTANQTGWMTWVEWRVWSRFPIIRGRIGGARPTLVTTGQSVVTRGTTKNAQRVTLDPKNRPGIYCLHIQLTDQQRMLWVPLHLSSPRSPSDWNNNLQLCRRFGNTIAKHLQQMPIPAVVAGDFNATPIGRQYQTFQRYSGLHSKTQSPFQAGTWPAVFPAWLGLPIDHLWSNEQVKVVSCEVGPRCQSDHRPVLVTLEIVLNDLPQSENLPAQLP